MTEEYIEIVHYKIEDFLKQRLFGFGHRTVLRNIIELERTTGLHFYYGKLDDNFPEVPKDTPIRLGGGVLEWCIKGRADYLRIAGYKDVKVDRSISLSFDDILDEIKFSKRNSFLNSDQNHSNFSSQLPLNA